MYSVNITCATGSEASVLHKMPEVPPPAGSKCATLCYMCALNEQPQGTDQDLMQDKLAEQSVLGLYEHGTVASTTPTFSQ